MPNLLRWRWWRLRARRSHEARRRRRGPRIPGPRFVVGRSGFGRDSANGRWGLTPAVAAIRTAHVTTGRPAQFLLVDAKASPAGGASHNRHRASARRELGETAP